MRLLLILACLTLSSCYYYPYNVQPVSGALVEIGDSTVFYPTDPSAPVCQVVDGYVFCY